MLVCRVVTRAVKSDQSLFAEWLRRITVVLVLEWYFVVQVSTGVVFLGQVSTGVVLCSIGVALL